MAKISLTGIKPTGIPHLGNYLGSILPSLELAKSYLSVYFIADYHALTTVKDKDEMRGQIHLVAATWMALGLDPEKTIFFQQSRVPEVFELSWILSCFTPKGILNRAHAYKAMVQENLKKFARNELRLDDTNTPPVPISSSDPTASLVELEKIDREENVSDEALQHLDPLNPRVPGGDIFERAKDEGINFGIFSYPVLMAADILLFGSDVVPVGQDQKQHLEIARYIARAVNSKLASNVLTVPEPLISAEAKTLPGIDGRKMSKSYDNVIPIFDAAPAIKKRVMRIQTDSKLPAEPKNPDSCNVFNLFKHFAEPVRIEERRQQYLKGGVGYAEMKEELAELLEKRFGPARERYEALLKDAAGLDKILEQGAEKARALGAPRMEKLRKKLGLR